jgi:hypothetical protein
MAKQRIFIPTYISSIDYKPARVLPRLLFYNGLKECEDYYIDRVGETLEFDSFPYFDNYSGQVTTTGSLSLLFNNEVAPYGSIPTSSLYTEYWESYVNLLYNPRTRLLNASAIIPLADYFQMELNDIVQFRGNFYHLRAINDYNLTTGETNIQLLGPILEDSINLQAYIDADCDFQIDAEVAPTTTTTTSTTTTTTSGPTTTTTTGGPTTTTTAGPTTTTTAAPTTTTTTSIPYCYTIETVQSAPGECFDCEGFFASSTDTILHIFDGCNGTEIFPPFDINVTAHYSDNSTGSSFFPSGYTSSLLIAFSDVQCVPLPECGEIASPTFTSASVVPVTGSITECCI